MDITSLYPNIDQEEGAEACKQHMDNRQNQTITSTFLKKIIHTVLSCNTLSFNGHFFHQIKGTAMGTPMAVNFANLFMSKFETDMLQSYEQQHGKRPTVWLRYIDDVFIVWHGSDSDLLHFMKFCNNYSTNKHYASTIKFTCSPPSNTVNFLDTTVTLNPDGTLSTTLYSKPTASHQYLHQKSYHPGNVIRSLPKSQFMRIRRICSSIHEYKIHA
jgi:hypothetical protein